MSFQNSYILTNRATEYSIFSGKNTAFSDVNPTPIDPTGKSGDMYFLMSSQAYDQNYDNYQFTNSSDNNGNPVPSTTLPLTFSSALAQDLAQAKVNGNPQLTIYIHGLEVAFGSAVQEMAQLGTGLANEGYSGLVIGFSWPSGDLDALNYATAWPATGSGTTVRDHIVDSMQAFITMLHDVQNLVPNLSLNIICHSEGNYMLMRGMAALSGVKINQVIMLAADIGNASLQLSAQNNGGINGQAIATLSNGVSVYSSIYDEDVLYSNLGYLAFHNPNFPLRLGQTGVAGYQAQGQLLALPGNVTGLDCSLVVNDQNIINLVGQGVIQLPALTGATPGTHAPFIHSSYRYIPQVLQDMSAVMSGNTPPNRVPIPDTNGQGYQMSVAAAAAAFRAAR